MKDSLNVLSPSLVRIPEPYEDQEKVSLEFSSRSENSALSFDLIREKVFTRRHANATNVQRTEAVAERHWLNTGLIHTHQPPTAECSSTAVVSKLGYSDPFGTRERIFDCLGKVPLSCISRLES